MLKPGIRVKEKILLIDCMPKCKMYKRGSYHDPSHHRSSAHVNKPFKGRHGHRSKSSVKDASKGRWPFLQRILTCAGKVEKLNVYKPKNHAPSKVERRNKQKQIQLNKKEEHLRNARFFGGPKGASRVVVCDN